MMSSQLCLFSQPLLSLVLEAASQMHVGRDGNEASSLCFCGRGVQLILGFQWLSGRRVFLCYFEALSFYLIIINKDYYVSSDTCRKINKNVDLYDY